MNKLTFLLFAFTVSASLNARDALFTVNIVNDSDGAVQILPDSFSMDAFKSISTNNPFSDFIMDKIREQTEEKLQTALEAATQIRFESGTSANLTFDFCPLNLKIKKLTGVGAGKEISYKVPGCKTTLIVINKAGDGFTASLQ